jgi:hypothetical protein
MTLINELPETMQLPTRILPAKKDSVIAPRKAEDGNTSSRSTLLDLD